jgi:hypothetical protein
MVSIRRFRINFNRFCELAYSRLEIFSVKGVDSFIEIGIRVVARDLIRGANEK